MIFQKALLRELATAALPTFFVLLGITLTTQLLKLLGQAASGAITSWGVVALLGLTVLNYLPVLLSLTLFIAVLMTLTRSYHDSEMIVWFSSGLGLLRWMKPVLLFAAPLVFTIGLLSLALSPWAMSKADELKQLMNKRDDVSAITPGVFRESSRGDRVYFVEEVQGRQNYVANVFVSSTQNQKLGVMVARRGYQETMKNGDRFLVLLNGRRYEGDAGSPEYKIYEFDRYAMRIETSAGEAHPPTTKTLNSWALVRKPNAENLAEFSWRLGLPLSALVLCVLAIPLSFVNPRAGRSLNLVLALLIYMTYSNLLSIAQAYIAQSKIAFATGLWGVHGFMVLLLFALFYRRLVVGSLWRRWR
jgi:lipopolysaccharide export system permease protein